MQPFAVAPHAAMIAAVWRSVMAFGTARQSQAMAEPPHVKMTGYNRSHSDSLRVVVFYASHPDTPFLEPLH
ncbi:hypothetical protein GCM10010971_08640 [Silvimonas amylolytica]|uniref:Secreted protein n=2 Tax=Silvimonas amylolytica TaxID=449663 RepID=A0ABQ2PI93_9NEIS|nr:hypothetical protein GCM10010971_08640 [Silvimonas amylolytica]